MPTLAGSWPTDKELIITAVFKDGPFVYVNLARSVICHLEAGRVLLIEEQEKS